MYGCINKKSLSLLLILSLLFCSLLPLNAWADGTSITNVVVELQNDTVDTNTVYKVNFNSNQIMVGGLDTIHIVFPTEYSFDTKWQAGHVDINGLTSGGVDYSNRVLSILLPKGMNIYGGQPVTVTLASGIMKNPDKTGNYTFKVYTSKETKPIESAPFAITEFEYANGVSKPHVTLHNVEGEKAQAIKVRFNTNKGGKLVGGNDQIIITFPTEIKLPSSILKEKVTINGLPMTTAAPIVVGQQVFLPLSTTMNFPENYPVEVVFAADSGITIPKNKTKVTLQVVTTTNTQPVTSYPFDVTETSDMPYVPADAKNPDVTVVPNGQGALGKYTFTIKPYTVDTFDSGNIMGFTLTFPSGTILPGTINPQYITVNGQQSSGVLTNPTRREIIFTLPLGVSRTSEIVIQIAAEAGIQNPPAGQYIMDIIPNKGIKTISTKSFEIKTVSDPVIVTPDPEPVQDKVVKLTINSSIATKNGESIILDVPAALIDNYTMVPIRFVADGLGAAVDYNTIQNSVNITYGVRTIVLWPGSTIAKVDNTPVTLAKAPLIKDGRTLVPIRFVAECFGATVEFVSVTEPITITVKANNTKLPTIAEIQASQITGSSSTGSNGNTGNTGNTGSTGSGSTGNGSSGSTGSTGNTSGSTNSLIGKTVTLKSGNNTANLRSGPGTSYSKVGLLLKNETAKIIAVNSDWYQIRFDYGMEAWIRSDLVDVK